MNCLICHADQVAYRFHKDRYQIWRCTKCSFQFVHPIPTVAELARFYDQSYAVPLARYASRAARNVGHIIDLERWQPKRGRLLEVGASYGHSLAAARARGWQVAGIELSPTASAYAREHFALPVFTADLLDAPFAPGSFDAAILWHVLEHTHDPRAQIARLFELLQPGGVLGLRVPNVTGFGARVTGRLWMWMNAPGHLWYFSPSTLPRLLEQYGFQVLETTTLRGDGDNPYQHLLVALGNQMNALRRRLVRARRVKRGETPTLVVSGDPSIALPNSPAVQQVWLRALAVARPITNELDRLSRPLITRLEAAGWGDELLCYARKPL